MTEYVYVLQSAFCLLQSQIQKHSTLKILAHTFADYIKKKKVNSKAVINTVSAYVLISKRR